MVFKDTSCDFEVHKYVDQHCHNDMDYLWQGKGRLFEPWVT